MERDEVEVGLISKKRRTGDIPSPEGEGSSEVVQTAFPGATKYVEDVVYKLYFKGLVSYKKAADGGKKTATAGFGVAIYDQTDKLMFELKEPVKDPEINRNGVEVTALVRGLSESLDLGIRKVVIITDAYQVYQYITGKWKPKQETLVQLMEQVRSLRVKFALSEAIRVPEKEVKPAFKLAKEAIASQSSSTARVKKKAAATYVLCCDFGDGFDYIDKYDDVDWANGCGCGCDFGSDDDDRGGFVDYYMDY